MTIYGQRKYFEYNNPDVIRIKKKVLNQLTTNLWTNLQIIDYIRLDTIISKGFGAVKYEKNGYFSYMRYKGKWHIVNKKYIQHSYINPDKNKNANNIIFDGIYGIVEINDSMLHLSKIQTSTRDMQRHMYFCNSTFKLCKNHMNYDLKVDNFEENQFDSISHFSREQLFFNGLTIENDSIIIPVYDTIYKIKWNYKNRK
jgi:hypothetical protein